MGNVSITKEFTWDMAHMLADHDGLCKNLHGHTYKMEVEVSRDGHGVSEDDGAIKGMIMDFKELKDIVKSAIVEPLDHAFMYWEGSTDPVEHEIARLLIQSSRKVARVNFRPTAEEMALSFFNTLDRLLGEQGIKLNRIRVWETPCSFAEVKEG